MSAVSMALGASAVAAPVPIATNLPTANVTAVDKHGHQLPADPDLQAGDHVTVTIRGFAPRAALVVRSRAPNSTEKGHPDRADGGGVLSVSLDVTGNLAAGEYRLIAVGPGPNRSQPVLGAVLAQVPNFGVFPFHVTRHSSHPEGIGRGHEPASGTAGLAVTGVDLAGALELAGRLLLVGAACLSASWRRGDGRRCALSPDCEG